MSDKIYIVAENDYIHDKVFSKMKKVENCRGLDLFFNIIDKQGRHPETLHVTTGLDQIWQVSLGVKMYAKPGFDCFLIPRSSASVIGPTPNFHPFAEGWLGVEQNIDSLSLQLANTVGLIDWDYRGDFKARFRVIGTDLHFKLPLNVSYFQVVSLCPNVEWVLIPPGREDLIPDDYKQTVLRNTDGFGSTDKKV